MPALAPYARESDDKDTLKCINFNVLAFNNCYVIDFSKYGPLDSGIFREKFYLNGHLTPAGYILTAKMVMTYIDYIIRHNIKDFDMVGFIGKEELLQ